MSDNTNDGLIPNNEIWYTSIDGQIVEPKERSEFGSHIVSNIYENGKGVITFSEEVCLVVTHFMECSTLSSITLPRCVEYLHRWMFRGCVNLAQFNGPLASDDGRCLIIDGRLVGFAPAGITEYAIPEGIRRIEEVFYDGANIVRLTLPESITEIASYAFQGCINLESINIPRSVIDIGDCGFGGCGKIKSITLPEGVTNLGGNIFEGCTGTLIIQNKLIEQNHINSNSPASNVLFDYGYWLYGAEFQRIIIGDNISRVGDYALKGCDSVVQLFIPETVSSIGNCAFEGCESLLEVYCKAETPPQLSPIYVFAKNAKSRKFYVPKESFEAYRTAPHWIWYAAEIFSYDFEE